MPDVELGVSFRRYDSLMWAASKELLAQPQPDTLAIYQRHLAPGKAFFYAWLSEAPADSILPEEERRLASALGAFLSDTALLRLLDTVRLRFPYAYPFQKRLEPPLKRLKHAFPELDIPDLGTHVNGYRSEGDLRTADYLLFRPGYASFGLHYFLGKDWPYYPAGVAAYQRRRFDPAYLEVLLISDIADGLLAPPDPRKQPRLLDGMVAAGIRQAFLHEMLPQTPDSLLFFYSAPQMEWAEYYEARIYKELIDKFFDTDFMKIRDYLSDKPYTTQLALESAPRIGEFCGWKIVEAYRRRHPEVSIAELCERTDYEAIFREAKYKP